MRKIKALLLCVVMLACTLAFVGCDKDKATNEYTEVYSVTYTVGGKETVLNSRVEANFSEGEKIDYEEYIKLALPDGANNISKLPYVIKTDKSNLDLFKVNDIMVYSVPYPYHPTKFYKTAILTLDIKYLKVKVIDNKTLDIINIDNTHKLISADSYIITYFN